MSSRSSSTTPSRRGSPPPRPYRPPRLDRLGDLRSLTLGNSPDIADSGGGGMLSQQQQP